MVWLEICSKKMLINWLRLSTARKSGTSSRPQSTTISSASKSSLPKWSSRSTKRFSMSCVRKRVSSRLISGWLRKLLQLCLNSKQMNTRVQCWACAILYSDKSWTSKFKYRAIFSIVWSLSTLSHNLGAKSTHSWSNVLFKIATPRPELSAILRRTWFIASITTSVTNWRKISRALKLGSSRPMAAKQGENSKRIRKLGLRSSRCRNRASKSHLRRSWPIQLQFNKLLPCEQTNKKSSHLIFNQN